MNCFDIIGPIMVGPSSSHTAGAVRLGLVARALAGQQPAHVDIYLSGSFAKTYRGHGTDRALLAGLLGFQPDDDRIRISPQLSQKAGLSYAIHQLSLPGAHPNTAILEMTDTQDKKISMRGVSTGGGRILVEAINDLAVSFSGDYTTLVINHLDAPGVISRVTQQLADKQINIANMRVFRSHRGGTAVMVIETDQHLDKELCDTVKQIEGILRAIWIEPVSL